jgi:hypothetical protein
VSCAVHRKILNKVQTSGQAIVTHTCNLATWKAEIRRTAVQTQPREIVEETLSQKILNTKHVWWSDSNGKVPAKQS